MNKRQDGDEEAEDFSPLDFEREVVDGSDASVALREVLYLNQRAFSIFGV